MSKDNLYWDQNAFNDLIRREMDFSMKREDRLFRWCQDFNSLFLILKLLFFVHS